MCTWRVFALCARGVCVSLSMWCVCFVCMWCVSFICTWRAFLFRARGVCVLCARGVFFGLCSVVMSSFALLFFVVCLVSFW